MDSFIRAYTNVIEKEHTEKIIKRFDEIADNSSFAGDAQFKSKARRHDDSIMLEDHSGQLVGVINKAIEGYLKAYLDDNKKQIKGYQEIEKAIENKILIIA